MMKKCRICGEEKPLEEFQKAGIISPKGKVYYRCECLECKALSKTKDVDKYLKNKKYMDELHILQKEDKRRCRHCDEIKDLSEFQFDSHGNRYKTTCKECVKVRWSNDYRSTDEYKKKKAKWDKQYNERHREKLNKKQCDRYHSDELFKLKVTLRNTLGKYLKTQNVEKNKSAQKLVGTSLKHLKEHLESQFQEGMSWDNWSLHGWHIDHIIPITAFDLSNEEEIKKCFHYTNLQPLWALDNIKKGNKI